MHMSCIPKCNWHPYCWCELVAIEHMLKNIIMPGKFCCCGEFTLWHPFFSHCLQWYEYCQIQNYACYYKFNTVVDILKNRIPFKEWIRSWVKVLYMVSYMKSCSSLIYTMYKCRVLQKLQWPGKICCLLDQDAMVTQRIYVYIFVVGSASKVLCTSCLKFLSSYSKFLRESCKSTLTNQYLKVSNKN